MSPGAVVTDLLQSQIGAAYATALGKILFHAACIDLHIGPNATDMAKLPRGTISVIFVAQRTANDAEGYAHAAATMETLARQQQGYIAMDSVRGSDGLGITVSYWENETCAKAWRDHPDHAAIRNAGRDLWYSDYSLHVAEVTRSYDWERP